MVGNWNPRRADRDLEYKEALVWIAAFCVLVGYHKGEA